MSKIMIVIGATGLVGSQVVRLLTEAEHVDKVVTLTRRAVSYDSVKVENHVVEFSRLADYATLFTGNVLFSCLGTTLKQAGSIEAQRRVDLDYQATAARLAVENGVNHLLLVSSSGANAKSMSSYLKMKGELEDQVKQLSYKYTSIFQPSLLLGKRKNARLAEGVANVIMPTLFKLPGLRRYRPIGALQVAQKMVDVSRDPQRGITKYTLDEIFPLS